MHNLNRNVWVERVNAILQHCKGMLHSNYDAAMVERLYCERALPKQAAMALVIAAKKK